MATTIIRGGRVLDLERRSAERADVLVDGGTIREIGPALSAPEGAAALDAHDRLLVPGLVNAHTHAHGALGKGLVSDCVPLEVFLASSGAVHGPRGVEDKYLSATLSAIEMVRKGCTAAYDLCVEYPAPTREGVRAVAQAYTDVGMRAVVAPMMADRTLWHALPGLLGAVPEPARAQVEKLQAAPYETSIAACRDILTSWPFDRARVRPALGPTIPLHCSDAFLVECRDLARDFDVGVQTHLAETRNQALLGRRKYGRTLTAHLEGLGLLGPRFSGAHGVWLDRDEIARLADAGASVAHNPLSNLRLGSGIAPVGLMRRLGLRVGIGTDSVSSSDTQNMFEAMRLATYLTRVQGEPPERWLRADEALAMATTGSAGVLGMGDRVGRIAPGHAADIVFLDLGFIGFVPLNDALLQLVCGESGAGVDKVMIDGRLVLDGGTLLTVDEAKVRRDAAAAAERLRAASAPGVTAARAFERFVGAFCAGLAREPYPIERFTRLGDPG
jgi:guanine deaminase